MSSHLNLFILQVNKKRARLEGHLPLVSEGQQDALSSPALFLLYFPQNSEKFRKKVYGCYMSERLLDKMVVLRDSCFKLLQSLMDGEVLFGEHMLRILIHHTYISNAFPYGLLLYNVVMHGPIKHDLTAL